MSRFSCSALIALAPVVCPMAQAAEPTPTPTEAPGVEATGEPEPTPTPAPLVEATCFGTSRLLLGLDQAAPSGEQKPGVISNDTLRGLASKGRISEGAGAPGSPVPAAGAREGISPVTMPAPAQGDKNETRDMLRRAAMSAEAEIVAMEQRLANVDYEVQVLQQSSNEGSRRLLEQAQERRRVLGEQLALARQELQRLQRESRE